MPEYLAPGVYVEETSFRSKSIEGVSTTTTGFIGPARYGPVTQTPDILTSLGDFERVFGGGEQLAYGRTSLHNFLWHGARAFFSEGGRRLYASRVFRQLNNADYVDPGLQNNAEAEMDDSAQNYHDGHARADRGGTTGVNFRARFPGKAGNVRLQFVLRLGGKLARSSSGAIQSGVGDRDLVYVQQPASGSTTVNAQALLDAAQGTTAQPSNGAIDEAERVADFVAAYVDEDIVDSADAADKAIAAALHVNLRDAIRIASEEAEKIATAMQQIADAQTIIDNTASTAAAIAAAEKNRDDAQALINSGARTTVLAARNMVSLTKRGSRSVRPSSTSAASAAAGRAVAKLDEMIAAAGRTVTIGQFLSATVSGNSILLANQAGQTVTLAPENEARSVTINLELIPEGTNLIGQVWENIALDPQRMQNGLLDNVFSYFTHEPANQELARTLPIIVVAGDGVTNGITALETVFEDLDALVTALDDALSHSRQPQSITQVALTGGNDGIRPGAADYEGRANPDDPFKTGLKQFEDLEDISIVAAPGHSYGYQNGYQDDARSIASQLIIHAQTMRYRIAVLDSGNNLPISSVREQRAFYDSKYAALYYPWIRVLDPITRQEITLPPSGFVAGIYARNDINRAVWKAPANEVVNLALGFERTINKAQQDVLNPEGINCFRFFEGRGMLLWGARTISSDPEWKYVNLRRYFAYLERSIDRGTQWAVFEPNGEALWANVRRTIQDFLLNEWQMGALLGDKPERAFFVKCDRSTMTQNDLDNGRLICLIGIAPLRPAEFVIFRIGQWTGDRRV
jgi:phage tail sheath protein FI